MYKLRKKIAHISGIRKHKEVHTHSKTQCALAAVCAALIPTREALRSLGQSHTRVIQNFQLVWLDISSDEQSSDVQSNTISILRHIVNTAHAFSEIDQCIKFINEVHEEKIFLIISGILVQSVMSCVHDLSAVSSIYILYGNKLEHESWTHQWSKIQGVFMDMPAICKALEDATKECDRNTISMSFIEKNFDKLDPSFVYNQVLKEIVSEMKFKEQDLKEFTTFYRKQIIGNTVEERNTDILEREYHDDGAIRWYTSQCFLCSVLNRSLRTMEVDTIVKMGFFIHDLQQEITQLHSTQNTERHDMSPFRVYRGQGISEMDFEQLKKMPGGLLSFNNFLFASKSRHVSLDFARQTSVNSNSIGILFVITIDSTTTSTPFANISSQTGEEILFSIHSIFRIGQMKRIHKNNSHLWQVMLSLVDDNDQQFHTLTERVRQETFSYRKGWSRWSELFIEENQLNKAQQVCDSVIHQTSDDNEKRLLYYQLGSIKFRQAEYTEANSFYHLSLEIRQNTFPPQYLDVTACHNGIGLVHEKMNQYSEALVSFQKASEIYEKMLPLNDPLLAICNNNIGRMFSQLNEHFQSIASYEKALEIYQNILPLNYPDIIAAYNNIGSIYEKIDEKEKAISFLEKALFLRKQNLPFNPLDMAYSYNHIGSLYEKMDEYSIAISYYEKSLEIYQEHLPADHLDLAALQNNIGIVYYYRLNYNTALSFFEKAHEIYRKNLPSDHPDLAASCACQGAVYEEIGKYSKALVYYKKAYEVYRNIRPLNYLNLATSHTNIASVYFQLGEYPTAHSCYEKALEIFLKYLPPDHLDLVYLYGYHGDLYIKMGDPSKARTFYQYAVDVGQISLSDNDPSLQQWKEKIEMIQGKL